MWRQIFNYALEYDQLLDTSFQSHFDFQQDYELTNDWNQALNQLVDTIQRSRRTAFALLLVSKFISHIARDFLLALLYISRKPQLKLIAELLAGETPFVNGAISPGVLVRGIYIKAEMDQNMDDRNNIRAIIRCCPNLVVYKDHTFNHETWDGSTDDLSSLPTCIESLPPESHIQLISQRGDRGPKLATLTEHCAVLRGLRSLSLESVARGTQPPDNSVGLSFPQLHTLTFELSWGGHHIDIGSWDLPQLRNVIVWDSHNFEEDPNIPSFFKAHGAKLVTLQLRGTQGFNDLQALLSVCGLLEDLTMGNTLSLASLTSAIKPLRRLALDGGPGDPFEDAKNVMQKLLDPSILPALEVVRFVDFSKDEYAAHKWSRRRMDMWVGWIQAWAVRGVRLEDSQGDLLQFPHKMEVRDDDSDYFEYWSNEDDDDDFDEDYDDNYGGWSGSDEHEFDGFV